MYHNYIHLVFHTNINLFLHHKSNLHMSSSFYEQYHQMKLPSCLLWLEEKVALTISPFHSLSVSSTNIMIGIWFDILILKLTRSCDFLGSRSPYLHCTQALSAVSQVASTIQHIIWIACVSWLPSKADFSKYSHYHLELSERNVLYRPGKDKQLICAAYPDIFDQHKCEKYIFARVSSRYVPIAQIKIGGHN